VVTASLYAERATAAAGALDVRIIELEASAFQRFDIVDGNAFQVHLAHLVYQYLEPIKFVNVVGRILGILKRHMVAEAGASAAYNSDAKRHGSGILLAHNFFYFRCRDWSNCNHFSIFTPCRYRRYFLHVISNILIVAQIASWLPCPARSEFPSLKTFDALKRRKFQNAAVLETLPDVLKVYSQLLKPKWTGHEAEKHDVIFDKPSPFP